MNTLIYFTPSERVLLLAAAYILVMLAIWWALSAWLSSLSNDEREPSQMTKARSDAGLVQVPLGVEREEPEAKSQDEITRLRERIVVIRDERARMRREAREAGGNLTAEELDKDQRLYNLIVRIKDRLAELRKS